MRFREDTQASTTLVWTRFIPTLIGFHGDEQALPALQVLEESLEGWPT